MKDSTLKWHTPLFIQGFVVPIAHGASCWLVLKGTHTENPLLFLLHLGGGGGGGGGWHKKDTHTHPNRAGVV